MRAILSVLILWLLTLVPATAQFYGPGAGGYGPGGGSAGALQITGVSLSSIMFTAGSAYSATAQVGLSGSGTVNSQPTLSLSTTQGGCNSTNGAQNAQFSFSGFTLNGPSSAGTYNICVLTTVAGASNSPLGNSFTITGQGSGPSLAVDGTATFSFYSTTSGTATLTTTNSNDVIIVAVARADDGPVVSVTSPHLTFTRRTRQPWGGADGTVGITYDEEWYAIATSPLSSEVVTVSQQSGSTSDLDFAAFGISGANTSTPYDTNGSLPALTGSGTATVSTTHGNDMICGMFRTFYGDTPMTGWTPIMTTYGYSQVFCKIFSSAQTNLAVTTGGGNAPAGIGDAIQGF